MKRETIITAIVFLVVGFFAGYITEAEFNWNAPPAIASNVSSGAANAAPAGTPTGADQSAPVDGSADTSKLPPGHLPLEVAGKIKSLEDQALQNPQDPAPRLEVANLYYDQHQYNRAAEWYEKGLELDPRNVSARTDLGTAYFNIGRPDDALKQYQESLRIDPNHEPTMFNMIIVNLQGTHDLAAARSAYDRLHRRNPSYPGLENLKESLDTASGKATGASAPR